MSRAGAPIRVVFALASALGTATAASAAEPPEITEALRRSVKQGMAHLDQTQRADGAYASPRYGKHVGITALAALAFMADGHAPGRGAYGDNVARALDFVLAHTRETGLIAAQTSHGPMYGHGFAALFLGEVYGMTGSARRDERVRDALQKAVRLIVDTQNSDGGWRYHPVPRDADISVTICQIMALRAARNAGMQVPEKTIEQAISYVRRCQDPETGGFQYMIGSGGPAFPRTAAGVASLYYAGVYEDEALERGLRYMMRYRPGEEGREISGHYFYGHYYAAQAMFLAGGEHWRKWFPAARQELIQKQGAEGAWDASAGKSYGTAMALLVLQVPNRYLPIFQR